MPRERTASTACPIRSSSSSPSAGGLPRIRPPDVCTVQCALAISAASVLVLTTAETGGPPAEDRNRQGLEQLGGRGYVEDRLGARADHDGRSACDLRQVGGDVQGAG